MNHIVCTNSLGPVSQSYQLMLKLMPSRWHLSLQMLALGQPCKQPLPQTAVQACYVNSFLHKNHRARALDER